MTHSKALVLDTLRPADVQVLDHGVRASSRRSWIQAPWAHVLVDRYHFDIEFGPETIRLQLYIPEIIATPQYTTRIDRRATIGMKPERIGTIPLVAPLPDETPDAMRSAFADSLVEAIGAPARERCHLLTLALERVADHHGMESTLWSPGRGLISTASGRTQAISSEALATDTFDPRAMAGRVRTVQQSQFRKLESLIVGVPRLSAHERLERMSVAIDGFARHGIDIQAWWRDLGLSL